MVRGKGWETTDAETGHGQVRERDSDRIDRINRIEKSPRRFSRVMKKDWNSHIRAKNPIDVTPAQAGVQCFLL